MQKLIIVLFLLLPSYAMAQSGSITFQGYPGRWYGAPQPNTCRSGAPNGLSLWSDCSLASQVRLIKWGRRKDVAPGSAVFKAAQDVAANKATVKPAPKVEEKTKPVIISNAKRQEWAIISLQLENAKLKAEAAVPPEIKKAVKDADEALAAFWKSVGVNPAELTTKWDVSDGQNGDIILTPKKVEEKPKTP